MARGGSDLLVKKNNKLESFLKRSLTEETFERIRAYESCIIVSDNLKENKAFRYVVLTDQWIYLTENPPKNIQAAVNLRDIVSVDLVNAHPDFLSGEERDNAQHIAITYWTSEGPKNKPRWRQKKSPRSGSIVSENDRSTESTPMGFTSQDLEDFGYVTQSTTSLQVSRSSSRSSGRDIKNIGTNSKKKKSQKQLGDSFEEKLLRSLKEEIEEHGLEDIEENGSEMGPGTCRSSQKKLIIDSSGKRNGSGDTGKPDDKGKMNQKDRNVIDEKKLNADFAAEDSRCQLCGCGRFRRKKANQIQPKAAEPQAYPSSEVNGNLDTLSSTQVTQPPQIEIDNSSNKLQHMSINSGQSESRRSSLSTVRPPGSRSGTPAQDFERSTSALGLFSSSASDLGGSVHGLNLSVDGSFTERRKVVLNIYLLTMTSPLLMLIRSAVSNYLIRSTLLMDPEFEKAFKSNAVRSSQDHRGKMELLFGQLKRELLNPSNTVENMYELLDELKTATETNFTLKKIFWKNPDLFMFLVRHLHRYVPKYQIEVSSEAELCKKIDEFEFVILLTDILSLMFRESEIIPARIHTLKAERGKAVLDLLMLFTCNPKLPKVQSSTKTKLASLLGSNDSLDRRQTDEEAEKLMKEFTSVSVSAVFELFLMAKQANWDHSEGNYFNLSWIIKVLDEVRATEHFVGHVVKQMLASVSPSNHLPVTPRESVLLFQQFSVILTFLEYSPRLTSYIKNTYKEEFKYFVQVPVIKKKVPPVYPISNSIMKLVKRVMTKVLEVAPPTAKTPREME